MGVYIKGMEMPKPGIYTCELGALDDNTAVLTIYTPINEPPKSYALIPVQTHGDLIDRDALHKLFEDQWHYLQVLDWNENPTAEAMQSGINWCINTMHDDAPTIIPASGEGER